MKKIFFLITCLFVLLNLCNAQIGIYKSVYGYVSGATQTIKTNKNNDLFVAINGGQVDIDHSSYFYGPASTGGNGILAKYDQNQNLLWGASFTSTVGNGFSISSIYVEQNSYVYILGTYEGTVDLDPGPAVSTFTSNGSSDICIVKLTQNGQFVWAQSIGSTSDDSGRDISVDNSGNVTIGAVFKLTIDADPGTGIANFVSHGTSNPDILLLQLDAAGNYNWAFNIGNNSIDDINKVLTYESDVYIFGETQYAVDFDPGPAVTYTSSSTSRCGFMAKYTNTGNFVKVRQLSASELNMLDANINKNGTFVVTGNYKGSLETNPAGPSYTLTASGFREGFIAKYDTTLQVQFAISTRGGISNWGSDCWFYGVDTDSLQNIYVVGNHMYELDFDPGPGVQTYTTSGIGADVDALVLKYSPTGQYLGSFKFGNTAAQNPKAIALNKNMHYYITGTTSGTVDYDPAPTTATLTTTCFLAKYGQTAGKTNTLNINICHGQNYVLNGKNYNVTGSYKEIFYLTDGTDSTVYLNLNVQNTNPSIVTEGSVLKSIAPAGATFQWLNCNGYTPIPGANSYSYAPATNDSYAVRITYAGCTDTSSCNDVFASSNAGIPQLNWAYYAGGWGRGRSLTTDNYNNFYVTGSFGGILDIDYSSGVKNIKATSTSEDIFLSKYDNNGNYIWSVPMGTSGTSTYVERGESVFVDDQQNVYVAGTYQFPFDIDPGPGVYTLNDPGAGCCDENVFIAKFNANGQLIWAKGMGGNGYVYLYNLSVDKSGNIAIVGEFNGTFDIDPGTPVLNLSGGTNALSQGYLARFDNNGTLLSAMSFTTNTTSVHNLTRGVTFDNMGNMIVTGCFTGTMDFDPSATTVNITSTGPSRTDIFYAKYSPTMQLIWAKRLGTAPIDDVGGFIVSGQNNGFYMSGKGGLAPVSSDFVARFDSMGVLKTTYSLTATDESYLLAKLAVDKSFNVYVAGTYFTTVNVGSGNQASLGNQDLYLVKYASTTAAPKWGFRLGSAGNENTSAIAVDKEGNVFATGYYSNTVDFDPSASGTYTLTTPSVGGFIAKYGQGCAPVNTVSTAGTGYITTAVANSFYEWKDCNTNQLVSSTTTNTFYPVTPGQYKAIIHQGNCIDSTACQTVSVVTTGLEVEDLESLQIYPVPALSSITIYSPSGNITLAKLYDVNGRLIFDSKALVDKKELNIPLETIKDGIYMLEITLDDKRISRKKIIKAGS